MINKVLGGVWIILLPFILLVYSPSLTLSLQGVEAEQTSVAEKTVLYVSGAEQELPSEYKDSEKEHMEDVLFLVQVATAIFIGSSFWFVLQGVFPFTKQSVLWVGGFIVGVGGTVFMSFELFFDVFHAFLFEEGTYRFPPEYLLVTLFPYSFFESLMRGIVVVWGSTLLSIYLFLLCND